MCKECRQIADNAFWFTVEEFNLLLYSCQGEVKLPCED
jgi:hypothetical protein